MPDSQAPHHPAPNPKAMLDLAARLALRAAGNVEPNPTVGAVIVKDGAIIGMGHHLRFGGLHAEREALADARRRGHDPRGSTIYVTLEPCRSTGKQPPCTDALLEAGVASVVIASEDAHGKGAGGAQHLRERGVQVEFNNTSRLALAASAPFLKRARTGLPFVVAKWAQTLDGRIATRTGESKWISAAPARRRVHRLRGRVDAILTGLGTVRADNPQLTARGDARPRRVAARVVVDPLLEISPDSNLVRTARQTPLILACSQVSQNETEVAARAAALQNAGAELIPLPPGPGGLDLAHLLRTLASRGTSTVLIESGPILLGSLLEADLIDAALVYIAPLVLGDEHAKPPASGRIAEALHHGRKFDLLRAKPLGHDIEAIYTRNQA